MATKIPPHCPSEVINACCKYVENPDISSDELIQYVKGPDFPTGGIIVGNSGIKSAYLTGKGSILIRGKTSIENTKKIKKVLLFPKYLLP